MATKKYITIDAICEHYQISSVFIQDLHEAGLIQLVEYERTTCLPQNALDHFERIIRMHHELQINPAGIDVVLNLLERIEKQQQEIKKLRNHLQRFDNELI